MPAKNSRKQYQQNGYYHIYNRGVEKRTIFLDSQDYNVFLSYLKEYLSPKNTEELYEKLSNPNLNSMEKDKILKQIRMNNFYGDIYLLAYCLMENHFHFLIKQIGLNSIDTFMNSLCTRYTMYFNKKYKRVGHLFQGVYKAILIKSDEQLIHLSRYIHQQSLALQGQALQISQPSSYLEYIKKRESEWVDSNEILGFFSKNNPLLSYESFVEKEKNNEDISKLLIETET